MESKVFLYISVSILVVILIFSYLNISQASSSPVVVDAEKFHTIEYHGEDRINLLFFSSQEQAKQYSDYLLSSQPYKDKRDYFNVYSLDEEVNCDYYQDIALLCSEGVKDIAKNYPSDYIFVIKEDSPKIRSSAYNGVISINSVHPKSVALHEFGHAFANFAEEYIGAKVPPGAKNCVSTCDKFKGEINGCFQGCSDNSHQRSIDSGVMRTLSTSDYGIYNDMLIETLLEKNKPSSPTVTGNQIKEEINCDSDLIKVEVTQKDGVIDAKTNNIIVKGCARKGEGPLCIGNACSLNTLFTDAPTDEFLDLEGETYLNPEIPMVFYIAPNNQNIEVTLDGQVVDTINTQEAGASACLV
jgi:hypothetical protein